MTTKQPKLWTPGDWNAFFSETLGLVGAGSTPRIVRRTPPRAALLATRGGVSSAFTSMRPGEEMFLPRVIGTPSFAFFRASWFGGGRYSRGMPAGLVAI